MAIFTVNKNEPANKHKVVDDASLAALMMLTELERFNKYNSDKLPKIRIGTGIHFGQVVAGLIGSPQKRSYTFMGDVVNTASRIEGLSKTLGANILITKEVYSNFSNDNGFLLRPVGKYQPKGKESPLIVADLMGIDDNSIEAAAIKEEINEITEYLHLFYNSKFKKAGEGFIKLYKKYQNTPRAKGYLFLFNKSKLFLKEPPNNTWKGEIKLFSK